MQISPPNDDNRLKALNRKIDKTKEPRTIEQTAPVAPAKPVDEDGRHQPRAKQDRRQQADRRQGRKEVLLDTRSRQERRKQMRRGDDREREDNAPAVKGIDVRT